MRVAGKIIAVPFTADCVLQTLFSVYRISSIYEQQHNNKQKKSNSTSKVKISSFSPLKTGKEQINLNSEALEGRQISYLGNFLTGVYQLCFCTLE